jgi:EAL domain-containing protein (putative c-di-GMP-specific phosphodiesterase class I)/FixJ family two-component response regulator
MRVALPELPNAVRQQKVLIVEDSAFQRELLCTLLNELGIRGVQQVADGKAALAVLRSCPDSLPLVLLDLEMPGMNGIELLERMGEEGILAEVLIISGREEALIMTVEGMLRAAGMPLLGSLAKPLSGQDLHRLLSRACGKPQAATRKDRDSNTFCEAELAAAIESGHIRPYYQPKVNLRSGRVSGYEVLARWVEPDGRIIYPGDFIPLATESELLSRLTFSLIDQVLLTLMALGDKAISMALNVDITLLADRHFADDLIRRVAAAGGLPSQWILEVTESAVMNDPQVTLGSVGRLRLAGFGLSIDDYGTGFSTLRQLSRLPFTELKIDRAFVREAHQNRRALAILYSAIEMGHKLGLPCVAEGIEDKEDLLMVERLGCHLGQGYFFARPIAEEQLLAWHAQHQGHWSLGEWISQ